MAQEIKKQDQKIKKVKPMTVRIEQLKSDIQEAVAKSGLPPFMLEMIIGEYLAGVSIVARREYAQDRAEWEAAQKGAEKDG